MQRSKARVKELWGQRLIIQIFFFAELAYLATSSPSNLEKNNQIRGNGPGEFSLTNPDALPRDDVEG